MVTTDNPPSDIAHRDRHLTPSSWQVNLLRTSGPHQCTAHPCSANWCVLIDKGTVYCLAPPTASSSLPRHHYILRRGRPKPSIFCFCFGTKLFFVIQGGRRYYNIIVISQVWVCLIGNPRVRVHLCPEEVNFYLTGA
jgi:hypothetical protein